MSKSKARVSKLKLKMRKQELNDVDEAYLACENSSLKLKNTIEDILNQVYEQTIKSPFTSTGAKRAYDICTVREMLKEIQAAYYDAEVEREIFIEKLPTDLCDWVGHRLCKSYRVEPVIIPDTVTDKEVSKCFVIQSQVRALGFVDVGTCKYTVGFSASHR